MMNDIFYNLISKEIMIVYLNILIFTRILEEYYKAVHSVLEVLAKYKLFLYPKKCKFNKQKIKYLGLVISKNQVEIDLVRVTRVYNWPVSKNCTDL